LRRTASTSTTIATNPTTAPGIAVSVDEARLVVEVVDVVVVAGVDADARDCAHGSAGADRRHAAAGGRRRRQRGREPRDVADDLER
jgi:hypothetical protein